jgi:kynurenine formamidase
MRLIDLTLEQSEGNQTHRGHGRVPLRLPGTISHGLTSQRGIREIYGDTLVSVTNEYVLLGGHAGTHVDAPYHVDYRSKITAEKLPLERTYGNALSLNLESHCMPHAVITVDDLSRAEQAGGEPIRPNDIVLINTGWSGKVTEAGAYADQSPGLTREAGEWLRERKIKALGVDFVSPDQREATDLPIHTNFLRPDLLGLGEDEYILIYENLININLIPETRFTFSGLPLPLSGASGSPVRAVAICPEPQNSATP